MAAINLDGTIDPQWPGGVRPAPSFRDIQVLMQQVGALAARVEALEAQVYEMRIQASTLVAPDTFP